MTNEVDKMSAGSRGYSAHYREWGLAVSERTKRILIDIAVQVVFLFTLTVITEKWWIAFTMFPYAMWNFYDGMTRRGLAEHAG